IRKVGALRRLRDGGGYHTLIGISAVAPRGALDAVAERIRHYDRELRPDIVLVSSLATSDASARDYLHAYRAEVRPHLGERNLEEIRIPDARAFIRSTAELNYGRRGMCVQTRQVYYHYDGSS